jgi:cobyrinic acid a,c-diamide synthase
LFDPLRDDALPEGTAALVIGGGFPEVYAEQLAANEPLKKAVRELASSGAPIAAECAGLLWLVRSLDGKPMCGVLDAEARMTERLTLGYRTAVAVSDSALAVEGTRANGHVFHRTEVTPRAGGRAAWRWAGRPPEGFVQDGVHASYLHTHWAANPGMARRLVDTAARMVQTMRQPTEPIPLPAGGSTLIEDAGLDVAPASDVDADDVRTGVVEAQGVPAVAEPDGATAVSTTEALADGRTEADVSTTEAVADGRTEADVSTTEALADGETAVDVSTTEPLVDAEPPEAVPVDQGLDDEDAGTAQGDGGDVGREGASGPAADDKGRSGSDGVTSGRRGEQPRWASEVDSADDELGPVGGER